MKNLESLFRKLGIPYDEDKKNKYQLYMDEILERNKYINLTAITDKDEFIKKHYIDSLLCGSSEEFLKAERVIDLGTGGGFPGIPLAIAFPDKKFVLADSLNKRIKIINEIAANLGIYNAEAVHGRAEELARKKTVILITHRLANARHADQIYVMEKGQVAEQGNFHTLCNQKGIFNKLWNAQQALENYGKEQEDEKKRN